MDEMDVVGPVDRGDPVDEMDRMDGMDEHGPTRASLG